MMRLSVPRWLRARTDAFIMPVTYSVDHADPRKNAALAQLGRYVLDQTSANPESGFIGIDYRRLCKQIQVPDACNNFILTDDPGDVGAEIINQHHNRRRKIPQPVHLNGHPVCFPKGELYTGPRSTCVTGVPGGYIARVGDGILVLGQDQRHLLASCSSRFAPLIALSGFNVLSALHEATQVSGNLVVLPGDYQSENYCHWLLDELPKILLAGIDIQDIKIAIRDLTQPFQYESLRRFGIKAENIIPVADFTAIKADKLIVFTEMRDDTAPAWHGASWALEPMRLHLSATSSPKHTPRKIYISRAGARGRRIINEDALIPILRQAGYQIIYPEKYSFQEQIKLFGAASHIIAPHGAGLANLVFCQNLRQLIEIFPPGYGTPFAHVLCNYLGARYYTWHTQSHIAGRRPQLDDIEVNMIDWQRGTSDLL